MIPTTDRPIRLMTSPSTKDAVDDLTNAINNVPTPFIPQSPTVRELTERPVTRDELRAFREAVVRAHRMVESALDKLIAG